MSMMPSAHVDTFTRDHLPPADTWPALEFTLPELNYPERLNAAAVLIDDGVEQYGADSPALRTPDGVVWTYGQLQQRSNQVAQVLTEDIGVVPGNRVLLRGPNNPWIVAAWLGVLKAGAVVVTTMPMLRSNEVSTLIQLTKPVVAISDHRFVDELRVAAGDQVKVLTYGSGNGSDDDDLTSRCGQKSGVFTAVDTSADDVALLGPTSGTTGVPKVTMHFHRDILANADTFARFILEPTADDVFAGSPPLAFTFGLGGLVVFPLRFGASSLLTEKAGPVELAEHAAAVGATILFTAPTAYRAILKEKRGDLLRGLRVAVSAGEHLSKETWEAVREATGLRLVNGIGATELLHVFISAAGDDIRPGTTGRAVPGFRATILDDAGNELGPGNIGRLAVIGPTGCRYLDDARQANYVVGGWNVTGDTFAMDADGYFTYQARSDNMIVSSGYNIGAPEVETAIDQHPDVVENAVIGVPDEERGSIVCAFVVLREGITGDAAKRKEIQDFVKQAIAPYKYPRDIRFVNELPRNPSGKLQHFKLRDGLLSENAATTPIENAAASTEQLTPAGQSQA
ncbi:AMP-binding protein [Paenarthrobacter sp. NPDC090517]|uniref:AMP-binding protein n=1 Tax=Paenarthrobacter sp. NPDC090517 TaxID=3364381 RepID=UPI003804446D